MQPRPIIHILVSLVDNYGDIGMTCEIIEGLGDGYEYIIWTDAHERVQEFISVALGDVRHSICIYARDGASPSLSGIRGVILAILRTPLPDFGHNPGIYEKFKISQKQEVRGRKVFSKGVYGGVSEGEQNFSDKEIRSFSEISPERSLILHIDHITLDPTWITHDGTEHMRSTPEHEIREVIPSPIGGAGLVSRSKSLSGYPSRETSAKFEISQKQEVRGRPLRNAMEYGSTLGVRKVFSKGVYGYVNVPQGDFQCSEAAKGQGEQNFSDKEIRSFSEISRDRHVMIFAYPDTLSMIDWESFPPDIRVYVSGEGYPLPDRVNIISLPLIPLGEFYDLIDTSEWVIIRGETSFSHVIQGSVPFFWDMYRGIGGVYHEQSEQFLELIDAGSDYREFHNSLNLISEKKKINYHECIDILSQTRFVGVGDKNLITTLKKYIDRFYNSI